MPIVRGGDSEKSVAERRQIFLASPPKSRLERIRLPLSRGRFLPTLESKSSDAQETNNDFHSPCRGTPNNELVEEDAVFVCSRRELFLILGIGFVFAS